MPCRSTLPRRNPAGWTCTGEGLTQVMLLWFGGRHLPMVCPTDRIREVLTDSEVFPYDGKGDHLHAVLPIDGDLRAKVDALIRQFEESEVGADVSDASEFIAKLRAVLNGELDPRTERVEID